MIIVFIQVLITEPRGATIKILTCQEYKYLLSAYRDLGLAGVTTSNVRLNTPQTILPKFKTPLKPPYVQYKQYKGSIGLVEVC